MLWDYPTATGLSPLGGRHRDAKQRGLADEDRVPTVLFTGSAEVGHQIADTVGAESGKRAACEMGGKNAIVITEDDA